jgi:hypothetical protein
MLPKWHSIIDIDDVDDAEYNFSEIFLTKRLANVLL